MSRFMWFYFMLLSMMAVVGLGGGHSRQSQNQDFVPGEVLVSFHDQSTVAITQDDGNFASPWQSVNAMLADLDLLDVTPLFSQNSPLKNVYKLKFRIDADIDAKIGDIIMDQLVKDARRNRLFRVDVIPNDYYFNTDDNQSGELDRWTMYKIQANRAWNVTKGSDTVLVAIVDTGLDFEHPDLDAVVWINPDEDINGNGIFDNYPESSGGDIDLEDNDGNDLVDDVVGWDWWQGDNIPHHDTTGVGSHGSVVGCMVSSETNNNYGIAGLTWHCKIMALKAGEFSSIDGGYAISAINYAIEKGAHIVNMSFSLPGSYFLGLHDVIKKGDSLGVIFVGSAGDYNDNVPRFPGSFEEVIRVAVVDSSDHKTNGSCYGDDVYISAPSAPTGRAGRGIMICAYGNWDSLYPGDQPPHHFVYSQIATSGGAGHVSGALALLKSAYPGATPAFLRDELKRGAEALPGDEALRDKLGAGRLNIYRSLTQWGTVTDNTTWSNVVYVSGDLTVAEGKTLTINPGTIINVSIDDNETTGSDLTRVEFLVDGYLDVNGTAGNPVIFQAWNSTGRSDWRGITFSTQSTGGEFDHVVIKNAETGIQHSVPVTLNKCIISDCEIGINSFDDLTLSNSKVTSCTDYCIRLNDGTVSLSSDTLSYSDQHGVMISPYSPSAQISFNGTECYIHHNTANGILASGEDVTFNLEQSTITNNENGVVVTAEARLDDISFCTITDNNTGVVVIDQSYQSGEGIWYSTIEDNTTNGVWLEETTTLVFQNEVKNNTIGIYCKGYGTSPGLADNEIAQNTGGIKCDDYATPVVLSNVIQQNATGVAGINDGNPNLGNASAGTGGYNSFKNNTGYHVSNFTPLLTILAENNYWGRGGPSPSKFYGDVDYDPYLGQDPNLAPPAFPGGEEEIARDKLPVTFALDQAFPNPFNPTTTIEYDVPRPGGHVAITVYNIHGQLVTTLIDEDIPPGFHSVMWNGQNTAGHSVASGVYFVHMNAVGFVETKKLLLLK